MATNFDKIFHNLLRHSDSSEEKKRALEACTWFVDSTPTIRKVSSLQEKTLYGIVYEYFSTHKKAPSLQIVKDMLSQASASPGAEELLNQYEESEEDLEIFSLEDLPQILLGSLRDFQTKELNEILKVAKTINFDKMVEAKTNVVYSGPADAIKYLYKEIDTSSIDSGTATKGSLNEDAGEIKSIYNKIKEDSKNGKLRIYTNLKNIDDHVSIKRGDFVGVLGYAGNRKSSLCRTIAYNSILQGFNVYHVSFEQSYSEELLFYTLIHASHPKWGRPTLSKLAFDSGKLSSSDENFLLNVVLPDLKSLPGKLIISQPSAGSTWSVIKTSAEIINQTTPIDMMLVDYLTLCDVKNPKDALTEINYNIKDAKQFALNFNNKAGLVFLTPVQGNREGWEEAGKNEGTWKMTGVHTYSEFERSLDTLLTVYMQDKEGNDITISSAKTRRSRGVPTFMANVNDSVGLITNPKNQDDRVREETERRVYDRLLAEGV